MDAESFTGIYRDIAKEISVDMAIKMFDLFRGQQVTFPQRLYDQAFVVSYIRENYDGHNIRELSHMFNYTDRRIRQIIWQIHREKEDGETEVNESEE